MPCVRVLHVLHSMNCGGAETLLMNIYRTLDRSKVQFDFLVNCFERMYFEEEIENLGGRIYRMKFLTKLTPPVYRYQLTRFFKAHPEYTVVHSHLETTTGLILKSAVKAGVPVRIAHSHNTRYTRQGLLYVLENRYKDRCKAMIVPNATNLLACSVPAAKWLFGGESEKAEIIKNGIETEKYRFSPETRARVRQELGISETTMVFGHVGRFYDQKNHLFLIDIFEAIAKRNPDSVLLLVGDGVLKPAVGEKVKAKALEQKVLFMGLRDDVHRLMQAMDLFLLPSKFEGLPVTLVEAQAAGLPCVVSEAVPREADLGCGLIGFLPLGNPTLWAENVDTKATNRLGANETVKTAGFDIRTTARRLEEFYCGMRSQSQ